MFHTLTLFFTVTSNVLDTAKDIHDRRSDRFKRFDLDTTRFIYFRYSYLFRRELEQQVDIINFELIKL
jgi:hypothetical protein